MGAEPTPVVHLAVPIDGGKSLTPCCGRTMLKLPPYDRVTADPSRVTCQGAPK